MTQEGKECIRLHFEVDGENFASAGEASEAVKMKLKQLGVSPQTIRRVSISMYEAEINMVIHAKGGEADVEIYDDRIELTLADKGPGIPDVELAMQDGYSTAPDYVRSLGFGAGMGFSNMKKYSDSLRVETEVGKGTTVRMTVFFND